MSNLSKTLLSSLTANASAILKEASELAQVHNCTIADAMEAIRLSQEINTHAKTGQLLDTIMKEIRKRK